jgi:hypothetical protein
VRRISHYQIRRLFNEILQKEYDENKGTFRYPDPSGGTRTHPHLPRVEFRGILSDDLIDQLDKAKITDISLLHDEKKSPLGVAPFLTRKRQELKLAVDRGFIPNRWHRIKSAFVHTSKQWEAARIRFEREDKTPGTVYVNTRDGTAQQVKYLKSVMITDIHPNLAESSKRIAPQLMTKMEELLRGG